MLLHNTAGIVTFVHHDTGAANTAWLIADEAVYAQQRASRTLKQGIYIFQNKKIVIR